MPLVDGSKDFSLFGLPLKCESVSGGLFSSYITSLNLLSDNGTCPPFKALLNLAGDSLLYKA